MTNLKISPILFSKNFHFHTNLPVLSTLWIINCFCIHSLCDKINATVKYTFITFMKNGK